MLEGSTGSDQPESGSKGVSRARLITGERPGSPVGVKRSPGVREGGLRPGSAMGDDPRTGGSSRGEGGVMAHAIRHADEVETQHGVFKAMRQELGASAFGVNQLQLGSGAEGPE